MSEKTLKFPAWLVGDPNPDDDAEDLLYPVGDVRELAEKIGWLHAEVVHLDTHSALSDAQKRIDARDVAARSEANAALVGPVTALRRLADAAGQAGDDRLAMLVGPAAEELGRELAKRAGKAP